MEELTVRCACHTKDHTVFFDYDESDGELYLTIHLVDLGGGFWQRLWRGLKYAFGYKSRFGDWDELIIRQEDCPKIRALLEKREVHPSKFVQGVLARQEE